MTKFNNFDIHSVHSIMKQRNSAINEYVIIQMIIIIHTAIYDIT